eukprot:sb/3469637/
MCGFLHPSHKLHLHQPPSHHGGWKSIRHPTRSVNSQNSLFRSRDWLSANQGHPAGQRSSPSSGISSTGGVSSDHHSISSQHGGLATSSFVSDHAGSDVGDDFEASRQRKEENDNSTAYQGKQNFTNFHIQILFISEDLFLYLFSDLSLRLSELHSIKTLPYPLLQVRSIHESVNVSSAALEVRHDTENAQGRLVPLRMVRKSGRLVGKRSWGKQSCLNLRCRSRL